MSTNVSIEIKSDIGIKDWDSFMNALRQLGGFRFSIGFAPGCYLLMHILTDEETKARAKDNDKK